LALFAPKAKAAAAPAQAHSLALPAPQPQDFTPLAAGQQPVLTVQFYNAANQPLGGPLTRAGGQTALAWYQLQLADVPVPCGAAWADVYVEQPAVWYQTWTGRPRLMADGQSL
jgi:hypothetical protein